MFRFKSILSIAKTFLSDNKIYMGRWNPMIDEVKKEARALRSSYDHCGDTICGKPGEVKELINKNITK